jgi:hypothetical protein
MYDETNAVLRVRVAGKPRLMTWHTGKNYILLDTQANEVGVFCKAPVALMNALDTKMESILAETDVATVEFGVGEVLVTFAFEAACCGTYQVTYTYASQQKPFYTSLDYHHNQDISTCYARAYQIVGVASGRDQACGACGRFVYGDTGTCPYCGADAIRTATLNDLAALYKRLDTINVDDLKVFPAKLPEDFAEAVAMLRRPYQPISKQTFERLLSMLDVNGWDLFWYQDFSVRKRLVTIGTNEPLDGYAIMPLSKEDEEQYLEA